MAKSVVGSSLNKASAGLAAASWQVQFSLHINLRSQLRGTATWPSALAPSPAAAAPIPDASSTARTRSSSGAAVPASLALGSTATEDACDTQMVAPYILQVKLSGLHGLQQEVPAAPGHTEQVDEQSWQDIYSITVAEQQILAVDEQLIRSWASAAGQLQMHVAVLPQGDPVGTMAKKPTTAPPAKNAAPVPTVTPIAAGLLQLNCAGLLVGDTSATYCWANPNQSTTASVAPAAEQTASTMTSAVCCESPARGKAASNAKSGTQHWKMCCQPPDGSLSEWLGSVDISLQLWKIPSASQDPSDTKSAAVTGSSAGTAAAGAAAGVAAASSAGSKPPAGKSAGVDAAGTAASAADDVLQPCSLLTLEHAAMYNPVVVNVYKAARLPDAPATEQQLLEECQPVKLKASWPPLIAGVEQVTTMVGGWSRADPGQCTHASKASTATGSSQSSSRPFLEPAVRTVLFSTPLVFLGCDLGTPQQLIQHCRSKHVELQVHDRTATVTDVHLLSAAAPGNGKPAAAASPAYSSAVKPQSVPAAAQAAAGTADAAPAMEQTQAGTIPVDDDADDGEVYGAASVSLLDLVRGLTSFRFAVPLQPASTVRGAASLDWRQRPGNYMQANSEVKGWVRAAVPLHAMKASKNGTASGSTSTTTSPRSAIPVAVARHGSRLSSTGAAAAASVSGVATTVTAASAVPSTTGGKGSNARSSAAQAKLLQQQLAEQQQAAVQPAVPELQLQVEQKKDQPPQPSAYIALPADVRYPGVFSRAIFLFDYRDSSLFHTLEDTIRQHNAIVLGLAPPPPPSAQEAEAAKAAAAAAETATASMGSRLGTAASRAAAAAKAAAAARAAEAAGLAAKAAAAAAASAAGSTAAAASAQMPPSGSTPRPILRASVAGNCNGSLVSAPSVASTKALHPVGAEQHRPHHAHFVYDLDLDLSDSESESLSESEADECELKLQAALSRYDHVKLDAKILQGLSTQQLDAQQASDPQLDVLTGFHLVDGSLRLVVVEGLAAEAGMTATVAAISRWALEDQQLQQETQQQQEAWLPRRVVHNPSIRYPERLYSCLGVDVWMVKLKAGLKALGAQPATFASGRVRPDCIAGMKCLLALTAGYQSLNNSGSSKCCETQPDTCDKGLACTHRRVTMSGRLCQSGSGAQMTASKRAAAARTKSGQPTGPLSGGMAVDCSAARTGAATTAAMYAGAGYLGRLLDEMQLYPTAVQMQLVDKKFGGELTKTDVLGVEANEPDSESDSEVDAVAPKEQQEQVSATHAAASAVKAASRKVMALLNQDFEGFAAHGRPEMVSASGAVASSVASSKSHRSKRSRNSRSRKSHLSSLSGSKPRRKNRRFFRRPLEIDNEVYLHLRQEAQRRREQRDLAVEHEQYLHELELSKQPVRNTWTSWNPQRAATKQLEEAIAAGTTTLQDTIKARQELDVIPSTPIPGTISDIESLQRGWYPHDKPFLWPAPRDPEQYWTHALKPSEYRLQELEEPWQEPGNKETGVPQGGTAGGVCQSADFSTLIKGSPGGLFTQDPVYWQSVHVGGDCWEEQVAAAKAAAKAEWASKVVVKDTTIHVIPGTGDKAPAQADRLNNLLKGQPVKQGFKIAHVAPPPTSMYMQTPWEGPAAPEAGGARSQADGMALGPIHECRMITSAEKAKWIGGKDFDARGQLRRSAVAKPGFSDAVTASLHDKSSS